MLRGDIWLTSLDPVIGHEIRKTRPCVIVSPDSMNLLGTVLAAPMTTGSKPLPFRIPVSFQGKEGLIPLDQIRAIDKSRLVKHLGALDKETLKHTLSVLREIFEE